MFTGVKVTLPDSKLKSPLIFPMKFIKCVSVPTLPSAGPTALLKSTAIAPLSATGLLTPFRFTVRTLK